MTDMTYIYPAAPNISIHGFIAYLLHKAEAWDIRCLESDAREYHASQYSRMHPIIVLRQELHWWADFVEEQMLGSLPQREEFAQAGLAYLHWLVHEQLPTLSDSHKLSTEMVIHLDDGHYLYKTADALGLFAHAGEAPILVVQGFPAQLITYAACTTIDTLIQQTKISDPITWVSSMIDWLHTPAEIMLERIEFDIPNVYQLYTTYLADAKVRWEEGNLKRYQSGKPQLRYFMTRLLKLTQEESRLAIKELSCYLSDRQREAFMRYLAECQQFIIDHTVTKKQPRSMHLKQFYVPRSERYPRNIANRRMREAATDPVNPAAALAKVVQHLQDKKIIKSDIRPHTHFITVINKTFGCSIKADSFSKHFR
jgi:hypothetical protein